jgi:hypothetical protein
MESADCYDTNWRVSHPQYCIIICRRKTLQPQDMQTNECTVQRSNLEVPNYVIISIVIALELLYVLSELYLRTPQHDWLCLYAILMQTVTSLGY